MLFPPHLDYLKEWDTTWFNPCWGYGGFWKRFTKFQREQGVDHRAAWNHRKMKRNKELYASALMALAMQQDTKERWWFTKPKQDPPDGLIGTPHIDAESGGNIMSVRELEIVEHFNGSLIDTITKKLNDKNKRYEPNTALVCLLSPDSIENYDFRMVSESLKKIKFPLEHIFAVFHGMKSSLLDSGTSEQDTLKQLPQVILIQFLPKYAEVIISPLDLCRTFREGNDTAWLRFEGRGRNAGFRSVTLDDAPKLFD